MNLILLLPRIALGVFFISYLSDGRKLINGLLFNIFIFTTVITFTYITFYTQNRLLIVLFCIMFSVLFLIFSFGIYALIIGLFVNAKIVMQRENKRMSNLLTLFLGIALLFHVVLVILNPDKFLSPDLNIFLSGFTIIEIYFSFSIFNFLMISLISQFNKPKKNQDFIIVLGSRVINNKVTPLLASRVDKSIELYNEQSLISKPPKIIFSGGKGPDEEIPEALAMQRYAVKKGVPIKSTIIEDKSVSTLENMNFSKILMDKLIPTGYNSIFVTNNYHLFRASLYAKMARLNTQGVGCKTALYFLPNALIREYIAIVVMNKKRNIAVILITFSATFILALINFFLNIKYIFF